jgi:hypothetical protein
MTGKFSRLVIGLTIFLSSFILFKEPFEGYITYAVFVLYFPIYLMRFGVPKEPVFIFIVPLLSGLVYIQTGDNETALFMKIFIGLFASVLFYRYVIQSFDFNLERLFQLYISGAVIVSLIGLFQVASFFAGFTPGYNYTWIFNKWGLSYGGIGIRMNSIFSEPAYFAGVIGPAFFVAVFNLFRKQKYFLTRRQSIIIIVAYSLTFSSLGIISMFVAALLLLINFGFMRYIIFIGPLLYFGYDYTYNNVDEFRDRIDGTVTVFSEGEDVGQNFNDVHGSSFVLYNNYVVAFENFKRNPFFGTGFGSHQIAFDKYSLTNQRGVIKIDFNKSDANSMFLRLMSETGLYGIAVMLYLIVRNYVSRQRSANDTNWLMSNAILVVILVYMARQGHYFLNGFPFFLWMYYFIRKQNDAQKLEKKMEATPNTEEEEPLELANAS